MHYNSDKVDKGSSCRMYMSIFLFVFIVLAFSSSVAFGYETVSMYPSIHDFSEKFIYTDSGGNIYQEMRSGFRSRNDLNDPIVRCSKMDSCDVYGDTFNIGLYQQMHGSTLRFRFFVPPGTAGLILQLLPPGVTDMIVTARWGQPPQLEYEYYEDLNFKELQTAGYKLYRTVMDEDVKQINAGGHVNLISQGPIRDLFTGEPYTLTVEDAGWVYVRIKTYYGKTMPLWYVRLTHSVRVDEYLNWYNSMTEQDWEDFGEPEPIVSDGEIIGDQDDDDQPDDNSQDDNQQDSNQQKSDKSQFQGGLSNDSTPSDNSSIGAGFGGDNHDKYSADGPSILPNDQQEQQQQTDDPADTNKTIVGGNDSHNSGQDSSIPNEFAPGLSAQRGLQEMERNVQTHQCESCLSMSRKIRPVINFQNSLPASTIVSAYAAFTKGGSLYIAREGYGGQIFFIRKAEGEPEISYGTETVGSDGTLQIHAFDQIAFNSNLLTGDVTYYFGVTPLDSTDLVNDVRGAAFHLINSQ